MHPDDLSARRMLSTAVVPSMPALTAAVTLAVGGTPDVLMLIVSTLVCIPLLVVRFWNLAVRRMKAEQALAHQASHDELTGLPNRRTLLEEVDEALRRLRAGALPAVGILFCDLDGFKPINDNLGHHAGDEFLIVCGEVAERSVHDLTERIRGVLAEPIHIQGNACVVGASVGVAVASGDDDVSGDSLIAQADLAMYVIKQSRPGARRAA